jgi:phosphohistidine phosphatase SixA
MRFKIRQWLALLVALITINTPVFAGEIVKMKTDAQIAELGALSGPSLVEQLQKGGHVIYIRHERATKESVERFATIPEKGCEQSNTISRAGGERALANQQAFKQLKLPIGKVFSSPYCRTTETAKLMIGEPQLTYALDSVHATPNRLPAQMRSDAIALINKEAVAGKNLVLFGHREGIKALTGIDVNTGDAVILEVVDKAEPRVVGFVSQLRWVQLAADALRKETMNGSQVH